MYLASEHFSISGGGDWHTSILPFAASAQRTLRLTHSLMSVAQRTSFSASILAYLIFAS